LTAIRQGRPGETILQEGSTRRSLYAAIAQLLGEEALQHLRVKHRLPENSLQQRQGL